jgi:hypothetical protein
VDNYRQPVLYVDLRSSSDAHYNKISYLKIIESLNIFFQKLLDATDGQFKEKIKSVTFNKYLGDSFLCAFNDSHFSDALIIAICLQVFSLVSNYKSKIENNLYNKIKTHFKIGIDIDNMVDVTEQIMANPLLGAVQGGKKELWGMESLDAKKIASFAGEDEILVGDEYFRRLESLSPTQLGIDSVRGWEDILHVGFNYDKSGRTLKVYRLSINISRDKIKSILGNPRNFDQLIPPDLDPIIIGDERKNENTGIIVDLADEKPILRRYYDGIISKYKLQIHRYDNGIYQLRHEEADKIYEYLFRNSDYYICTTTLLPSEYNKAYTDFLKYHVKLVNSSKNQTHENVRIIVHHEDELIRDYMTYEDAWNKFLNEQKDKDGQFLIKLLWIDRDLSEQIHYDKHDILKSIDLGVWYSDSDHYKYCAQWQIDKSVPSAVRGEFWLTSKKEEQEIFDNANEFLNSLRASAKPIETLIDEAKQKKLTLHDKDLITFSRYIASNWKKYVNPPERKRVLKQFIEPILQYYFGKDYGSRTLTMLDASSGIGCDAVVLKELSPNSEIYFNESSVYLNENAVKWLKHESGTESAKQIEVTSTPWELLDVRFQKEYFDLILVLGNFIARGKNLDVIKEYLEKFKALLKPNGILIVDHRNYAKLRRYLTVKERYFEEFVDLHKNNPGLYLGFGEGGGHYTWPLNIDNVNKKMTLRFDETHSEEATSEDKDIDMTIFDNVNFWEIIKEVFGNDIKRHYDYRAPQLWSPTVDNDHDFRSLETSNFLIYVISKGTNLA